MCFSDEPSYLETPWGKSVFRFMDVPFPLNRFTLTKYDEPKGGYCRYKVLEIDKRPLPEAIPEKEYYYAGYRAVHKAWEKLEKTVAQPSCSTCHEMP